MDDKKNIKLSSTPSMHVGLILDVPNNILDQLIRFDRQYSFLEEIFYEFDGEIIALINGNSMIPYYDFNEFLLSTLTFLSNKSKFDNNILSSLVEKIFSFEKKKLFDENFLQQIVTGMEKNEKLIKLKYSKEIYIILYVLKQ